MFTDIMLALKNVETKHLADLMVCAFQILDNNC